MLDVLSTVVESTEKKRKKNERDEWAYFMIEKKKRWKKEKRKKEWKWMKNIKSFLNDESDDEEKFREMMKNKYLWWDNICKFS